MSARRALHFVFKVGDRPATIKFYKDVLGMKVSLINYNHITFVFGLSAVLHTLLPRY